MTCTVLHKWKLCSTIWQWMDYAMKMHVLKTGSWHCMMYQQICSTVPCCLACSWMWLDTGSAMLGNVSTLDPQAAENLPYPLKLYLPPKIRRKKLSLTRYQPNFDEELAAGKNPAKIWLLVKNCWKTFLHYLHFRGIPTTKCHLSIGVYFLIVVFC